MKCIEFTWHRANTQRAFECLDITINTSKKTITTFWVISMQNFLKFKTNVQHTIGTKVLLTKKKGISDEFAFFNRLFSLQIKQRNQLIRVYLINRNNVLGFLGKQMSHHSDSTNQFLQAWVSSFHKDDPSFEMAVYLRWILSIASIVSYETKNRSCSVPPKKLIEGSLLIARIWEMFLPFGGCVINVKDS